MFFCVVYELIKAPQKMRIRIHLLGILAFFSFQRHWSLLTALINIQSPRRHFLMIENFKVAGLCAVYVLCISSFWSNQTVSQKIRPDEVLVKCEKDENQMKCQAAVAAAYKKINAGTCRKEIRSSFSCKKEWCGKNSDRVQCGQECRTVESSLKTCEKKVLKKIFMQAGMTYTEPFTENIEK